MGLSAFTSSTSINTQFSASKYRANKLKKIVSVMAPQQIARSPSTTGSVCVNSLYTFFLFCVFYCLCFEEAVDM